jgi:hypothetical protein
MRAYHTSGFAACLNVALSSARKYRHLTLKKTVSVSTSRLPQSKLVNSTNHRFDP